MEAAACGVPAIVTRCGGIPEIVLDGSTGSVLDGPSLVNFAAELSAYVSDPPMAAERGRNARRHILRNYSKTVHLEVLRDAIAGAAAESPQASGAREQRLHPEQRRPYTTSASTNHIGATRLKKSAWKVPE
jgi:hypothetical protein